MMAIGASAHVEWLEGVHDFGAFDEDDGNVSCSFRFVNHGPEPVAVISARPSCGCTVPSFPRKAIAPGDTASIDVTYNPTGRPGRFDKNVKVQLSDGDPANVTLHIRGVVIGNGNTLRSRYPVDADPLKLRTRVVTFGEVIKGRSKAEFFEVYNASADSVEPEWISKPKYVRTSVVSPVVPPGEQIAYAITLIPDFTDAYGLLVDSITLRPAPGAEPIVIDLVANISEDFSRLSESQLRDAPHAKASTTSVDFDLLPSSGKVTRTFTIANTGKNELKVRRVFTADPGIEATISSTSVKKGKQATVTVTVDVDQLPSELLNGRIQVITNDPDNPTQIIRAVGRR